MTLHRFITMIGARAEDRKKLLVMTPVFFLCGIAEMMNSNGFLTLFNKRFGVENLPYVYAVEAVIIPLEAWFMSWLTGRMSKPQMMRTLYVLMTGIVLVNALILSIISLLHVEAIWYYPLLFISSNFVVRQLTILLWSLAVDLCPTQQAKRLMPLFVSSATLGGIVAGVLVQAVNSVSGPEAVYMCAPVFLLAAYWNYRKAISRYLVPLTLNTAKREELQPDPGLTTWHYFKGAFLSPFLLCAIGLMTLMPALYFLMEYQYLTISKETFHNEEDLGSYYGLITSLLFTVAFLLQFISGKLMGRLGASNMLVAISTVFFGGFVLSSVFVETGLSLYAISLGYMLLYLLLYYFAEPSNQLFFKMLPLAQRDGFRYIAQGIATSAGIMLGALMQLLHSSGWLDLSPQAVIGIVGSIVLIVLAWLCRQLYLRELIKSIQVLQSGDTDLAASFDGFMRNQKALSAVLGMLLHPNDYAREIALEVIGRTKDRSYLPQLLTMVQDPSARIRIASLRAMNLEGADLEALVKVASILEDKDFEVRAEGVKLLANMVHMPHQAFFFVRLKLLDQHPMVVAEAVKTLFALQSQSSFEACYETVDGMLDKGGEAAVYICRAVATCEMYSFIPKVQLLLDDPLPAARVAAIQCLGELKVVDAVPKLLTLLPISDRELRKVIAESLVRMEEKALPYLQEALNDKHPTIWNTAVIALSGLYSDEHVRHNLTEACMSKLSEWLHAKSIVGALARSGHEQLSQLAKERLAEIQTSLTDAAWTVIGRLTDEQVAESVKQSLQDEDEETRENAMEVLAEGLGDRRLSAMLLQVLGDQEQWREPEHMEEAIRIITDASGWTDYWLREMAVSAIERMEKSDMQDERKDERKEERKFLGMLDKVLFLKQVSFFSDLSLEELGVIAGIAVEETHPDQTFLLRKGETNSTIYVIVEGHIELSSTSSAGWEGTIGVLGTNEVFGETSALDGSPSSITAQALLDEVRVLVLTGDDVSRLIRLYPEIGIGLLRASYTRVRLLEEMVMKMGS